MDNSGKEKEAEALMAEADKKIKSSKSFFGTLFGGSSRSEEACEIYVRAANMYKMAKNWSAAGNAFAQAAHLHLQMQSKHDAATNLIDAGNAFKKADPQEAINCLNRAIEIYTDMGRFTIAAKHHITIAEIYETELLDIDKQQPLEGAIDVPVLATDGNAEEEAPLSFTPDQSDAKDEELNRFRDLK